MAKAKRMSVKELNGKEFFIPAYQRGYRWDQVQIKELLDDLYEFFENNEENDFYCLQLIVVKELNTVNKWEVIDGQQRLTALWFLNLFITAEQGYTQSDKNSYTLEYEKKKNFQDVFENIRGFTDEQVPNLKTFINNFDKRIREIMNLTIDGTYAEITFDTIFRYGCREESSNDQKISDVRQKLEKVSRGYNNDKIEIIWYELTEENVAENNNNDKNEIAINTFLNINSKKIELTNAELIKAQLLHVESELLKRNKISMQWEEIEKGLNIKEFWNFISNNDKEYDTKIDYLFEIFIYCYNDGVDKIDRSDRHAIFREIDSLLKKKYDVWGDILEIFETLNDWYDCSETNFNYHTIGLLILLDKENEKIAKEIRGISVIKDLYVNYKNGTKSDFRKEIIKKLKTKYDYMFNDELNISLEQIKSYLIGLEFSDDKKRIRHILLLYNVLILVNSENKYERFPFELYKDDQWDIEHINPQTPRDEKEAEKKEWLESYQSILANDDDLSNKITVYLKSKDSGSSFKDLKDEVFNKFQIDEVCLNQFGNLTLLDSGTNRAYHNDSFQNKRKKIINIVRNEIKTEKEKYIPVGTKWVFLKGHITNGQLSFWDSSDAEAYVTDVAERITYFFEEGKNDED